MDDLILKVAIWQDERWVDRLAMLKVADENINANTKGAVKVILLSPDPNRKLRKLFIVSFADDPF